MSWQRANIQAAVNYLRERMTAGAIDGKTVAVFEGLLEVLEPNRRTARLQREMAQMTKASVPVTATRERRGNDRRLRLERRKTDLGSPDGVERRAGRDRRGGDRRGGR